jgi:DNA-binding beta-propeller fold protein YncE
MVLSLICLLAAGCGEKIPAPTESESGIELGDTTYIQISPPWDGDHGYDFSQPKDILLGYDTFIYIADTGNDRVLRMDAAGTVLEEYGGIPHPTAITQDELARLTIANNTQTIYKIDVGPEGGGVVEVAYQVESWEDSLRIAPTEVFTGVADSPFLDKFYFVAVSDTTRREAGKVMIFRAGGFGETRDLLADSLVGEAFSDTLVNPVVEFGSGAGYAHHPNGIYAVAYGDSMRLFMTQDSASFKAQVLTVMRKAYRHFVFRSALPADGSVDIYTVGLFYRAEDVCIDPAGNIFVVDAGDGAPFGVYKFSWEGELLESFGEPGSGPGQLLNPHGIAYDPFSDRRIVLVADTGNNRILRFKLNTDIE